jgi:hypothetical protein
MSWLPKVVARVRELATLGKVQLTYKALIEAAELGCDASDVVSVLRALEAGDSAGRIQSTVAREWLYVWKPEMGGVVVYLKLAVRDDCIVVSFHEDGDRHEDER